MFEHGLILRLEVEGGGGRRESASESVDSKRGKFKEAQRPGLSQALEELNINMEEISIQFGL